MDVVEDEFEFSASCLVIAGVKVNDVDDVAVGASAEETVVEAIEEAFDIGDGF